MSMFPSNKQSGEGQEKEEEESGVGDSVDRGVLLSSGWIMMEGRVLARAMEELLLVAQEEGGEH